MVAALNRAMSPSEETHVFLTDDQRARAVESIFDAVYEDKLNKIVFDNNRAWCARMGLIATVFPQSRVISCVRQPAHIIDSFERLFAKHPLAVSTITNCNTVGTVYDRVPIMMQSDGVLGFAYNALREAFYGAHADRLIILEYVNLTKTPRETMAWLHDMLQWPAFQYDFEAILPIPEVDLFDRNIGAPGLHTLKKRVVYTEERTVLPPDILTRLPPAFWRPEPVKKDETNPR